MYKRQAISFTQSLSGSSNHSASRLSSGTLSSSGILFSEHTFANARAVLPAEATTSMRPADSSKRPHTLYASVSLKEQVVISAPFSGK